MAKKQRPFTCEIGHTLRGARLARKLTQSGVSHRLDSEGVPLSRSTVSRIERGENDITLGALSAFCRVYSIDVLDVMTGLLTPGMTREQATR